MFPQEPHRHENQGNPQQQIVMSRTKIGLETPLVGRFLGENKKLIFAPPLWYDSFVLIVTASGFVAGLLGMTGHAPDFVGDTTWWIWVGFAVFGAGILGLLSSERINFDLRKRTYWRREGQGPFKRYTQGSLTEIDAIVLQASEYPAPQIGGRTIIYRLILFWKNNKEPLFIAEKFVAAVPLNMPVNAGAGFMLQKGMRYSKEMQVPFFDNSHFISPDPQRVL